MIIEDLSNKKWGDLDPISFERIIEGEPFARTKTMGKLISSEFGLWEVSVGRFKLNKIGTEIVYILDGFGWLISSDGSKIKLEAQACFVIPDGFSGEWVIEQTVTKFFVQL